MTFPGKGRADYLDLGDWNCVCFECGRKRKASTMKKHWQGYYVCPEHWEPRQPQDFVRGIPDVQTPPWTQPMPQDVFGTYCSINGTSAVTDYATADCSICDYIPAMFDATVDPPACNALYYLTTTTVDATEITWACGCLVIDADVTLDGLLGVTHGTTTTC